MLYKISSVYRLPD